MSEGRRFEGDTLVIASHNRGKIHEIAKLLQAYQFKFISAADLNIEEPEETAQSFVGNAKLKAEFVTGQSGKPSLADDSGLVVYALKGAPGIYSARWAGPDKNFGLAMQRVLDGLGPDAKDRRAAFVCALALAWPDGHVEVVEGRIEGSIAYESRGNKGFGYDPIFIPNNYDVTFGEIEPAIKNEISHRTDAFRKLVTRCFKSPALAASL